MSKSHSTRRHRRLILLENRAMDTRHHRVHEGGEKQGANNRVLLGQFHSKWGNLAPLAPTLADRVPKQVSGLHCTIVSSREVPETPTDQQQLHKHWFSSQSHRAFCDFCSFSGAFVGSEGTNKLVSMYGKGPWEHQGLQTSHHTSENKDQVPALLGYPDPKELLEITDQWIL